MDQHFLHVDGPFYEGDLTIDRIDAFDWPDGNNPGLVAGVADRVQEIMAAGSYARVLYLPGGVVHRGYAMRGFENYLRDLYRRPEALTHLMDKLCDFWIDTAVAVIEAVGPAKTWAPRKAACSTPRESTPGTSNRATGAWSRPSSRAPTSKSASTAAARPTILSTI
jgi:hypothetical protein